MAKSLTISEREAFSVLLRKSCKQEIEQAVGHQVAWESEVKELARKLAIGKLGIAKSLTQISVLEKKIGELEKEKKALERAVRLKMPLKEACSRYKTAYDEDDEDTHEDICSGLNSLTEEFLPVAEDKHKVGNEVRKIRRKYDKLFNKLAMCSTREEVAAAGILD